MNIKWIGTKNFGYPDGARGRRGRLPIGIVLHIAEGSMAGIDSWYNSEANTDSSSHYAIGKDGSLHQYVELTDAAWANGVVKEPMWALLDGMNPNLYTISIEHEGFTGEPWTERMLEVDIWLIRRLCDLFRIPKTPLHIIGHNYIDSVTRANCPGTGLPWERLFLGL